MNIQDELAERDRDIFRLRMDGATFKEIGERFDISLGRARQIFNAAEMRIRQARARGDGENFVPRSRYGAPKDRTETEREVTRTEELIAQQEKRIESAKQTIAVLRDRLNKLKDQA